jgi:hypothetical protein
LQARRREDVGTAFYARVVPRSPSPHQYREMREALREFNNLYIDYLNRSYPPSGSGLDAEARRLRGELQHRLAEAQMAIDAVGVGLAMLPPPAFGGPVLKGLTNTLFIHETSQGYTGMGAPPFFEKVLETLQVADGYLERKERDEIRRRKNPLYWLDLVLTAFLGIPAYIVSRIIGVPVWKIEDSPLGFALRLLGLAIDGLVVYFGGHELHWW